MYFEKTNDKELASLRWSVDCEYRFLVQHPFANGVVTPDSSFDLAMYLAIFKFWIAIIHDDGIANDF